MVKVAKTQFNYTSTKSQLQKQPLSKTAIIKHHKSFLNLLANIIISLFLYSLTHSSLPFTINKFLISYSFSINLAYMAGVSSSATRSGISIHGVSSTKRQNSHLRSKSSYQLTIRKQNN